MEIKFILTQQKGKTQNLEITYFTLNTLYEARKIDKDCIDEYIFNFIKGLEVNSEFIQAVKQVRSEFSIPTEGYSFDEWQSLKANKKGDRAFSQWRAQVELKSITGLKAKFSIPTILFYALPNIVLCNSVFIPLRKVFIETPYSLLPAQSPSAIKIVLNAEVSKNYLLDYIDKHWPQIYQAFRSLNYEGEVRLSQLGLHIVELKDKYKLTFREIADKLQAEIDDPEAKLDEINVKATYHRTKTKIGSLKRDKSGG